jgi:hypothetical protein
MKPAAKRCRVRTIFRRGRSARRTITDETVRPTRYLWEMRASRYNAALLAPLAKQSRSMAELLRRLGLEPTGGNYRHISRKLRIENIDVAHFQVARWREVPVADLERLVRESRSVAQVLAKLNRPTEGRPHRELTKQIRSLGFDTSHFRGSPWNRGETKATHPSLAARSKASSLPDEVVFVENSRASIYGPVWPLAWSRSVAPTSVNGADSSSGATGGSCCTSITSTGSTTTTASRTCDLCPNCYSQTPTYGNRGRR